MSPIEKIKMKRKKIMSAGIVIVMLLSLLFVSTNMELIPSVSGATTSQFLYNKKITIDSDQVPATLTNFPVCINLSSDADLASDALNSGWDIAFFDGTGESATQYNHEIDVFDGDTGELVAWVNVTSLSHSSDTEIYMFYGDSDIGSSAEDITGTWHSDYKMVHHMTGASATAIDDSTSNNNDVDSDNDDPSYNQTGRLGNAIVLDGTGDYLVYGDDDSLSFGDSSTDSPFTIVFYGSYSSGNSWIFSKGDGTNREYYFGLSSDASGNKLRLTIHDNDASNNREVSSDISKKKGVYQHFASRYGGVGGDDAQNDVYLYMNGSIIDSSGAKSNNYVAMHNQAAGGRIGDFNSWGPMAGTIDELWVIGANYSNAFMKTLYNNWNNCTDGGFFSLGSEQSQGIDGTYEISGLDGDTRFTHSGENGTTNISTLVMKIYSNTSGTSDNCSEIFLDFSAGQPSGFDQGNFSFQVRNISDGTFSTNWATVSGNMTLNSTTWLNNWAYGTDPFTINNYNSTIEVRMRVTIPSDVSPDTYTYDSWEVLWKVES